MRKKQQDILWKYLEKHSIVPINNIPWIDILYEKEPYLILKTHGIIEKDESHQVIDKAEYWFIFFEKEDITFHQCVDAKAFDMMTIVIGELKDEKPVRLERREQP